MDPARLLDDEDPTHGEPRTGFSPPATPCAFEFRAIREGRSLAALLARGLPDSERVGIGLTELAGRAPIHRLPRPEAGHGEQATRTARERPGRDAVPRC